MFYDEPATNNISQPSIHAKKKKTLQSRDELRTPNNESSLNRWHTLTQAPPHYPREMLTTSVYYFVQNSSVFKLKWLSTSSSRLGCMWGLLLNRRADVQVNFTLCCLYIPSLPDSGHFTLVFKIPTFSPTHRLSHWLQPSQPSVLVFYRDIFNSLYTWMFEGLRTPDRRGICCELAYCTQLIICLPKVIHDTRTFFKKIC